jgi:hypothetical protein
MPKLFCLLQGQPRVEAFPVNIENGDTIGDLKRLVKEELRPALDDVVVSGLEVYKVSIPKGGFETLGEESRQINQGENTALDPTDIVGDVFSQLAAKSIYAIIKASGKSPAETLVSILLLDRSPLPFAHVLMDTNLFFVHSPTYGEDSEPTYEDATTYIFSTFAYSPPDSQRKKTKTTTKSTWARTPISVVDW